MSNVKLSVVKSNEAVDGDEVIEYKVLYPRPLPILKLDTTPDDTRFTLLEKAALRNFLLLFERAQYKISRKFFVDFFSEYEFLIERFRSKNGKLNMKTLTHHCVWVQQTIIDLITIGLQSKGHLDKILQNCIVCHNAHFIEFDDIKLFASEMDRHLRYWYSDVTTPTLSKAFDKFWSLIRDAHEDSVRRSSALPVNYEDY